VFNLFLVSLWVIGLLAAAPAYSQETDKDLIKRGRYIFALAGGCACHTVPEQTPHVGARQFPIPMAKVYSTNLTADKETGLGAWTDRQIHDAMVKGIRADGTKLLPVMPYEAYSGMAEEDLKALIAYLRTLKPVRKETPALKTWAPLYRSMGTFTWLKLFSRFSESHAKAPESGIERGRYLVDHVALCGDCHTPRNLLGVFKRDLYLAGAGADIGPLGEEVPNITPDMETGIGKWSREEIAELLITGFKPDLDNVQGLMEEVVDGTPLGFKDMKREDALAIADYLKTIPPIVNKIK
jgi:mono/diheme cytochrome c family protein